MARRLEILLLLLFFAQYGRAQHPFYYTITDDNGLPSNEVYDIEQDSFGYIWIGCDAGLFRYDGFRFGQYSNRGQNAVAISTLRFSSGGRLYCQNFFGQVFSCHNDSLHIVADVKDRVKGHPEFATGPEESLLVSVPDGVLSFSSKGRGERQPELDSGVFELEFLENGELYFITYGRELMRGRLNEGAPAERVLVPAGLLENRSTYSLRAFGSKLLLTANDSRLNVHSLAVIENGAVALTRSFRSDTFAERMYNFLLVDDRLWICTSDGAYLLTESGEIEAHYFPGEKISDVLRDREGAYWFSSLQNGLFVVPHLELRLLNAANSMLTDDNVTAVRPFIGNSMLLGTYRGDVYTFDFATNGLKRLARPYGQAYRNVTCIMPQSSETIIVARGGLSSINIRSGTERYYSATYIRDIAEAGDSLFFVSTEVINSIATRTLLDGSAVFQSSVLARRSGKRVCYDAASKTLWFTLNTGLAYRDGGDFRPYLLDGKPLFSNALYADKAGLWVGTIADGVYNIRARNVYLHLNESNGLLGNNIKCFASRGDTLYIATDVCINIRYPDGRIRYLRHANGINAKEINAMCVCGPYLMVGTLRGLFYVPVQTIFLNQVQPNIQLVSVVVDGVVVRDGNVRLGHDNRDIAINFSSVSLKSRGKFNYHYRITGFQNDWKAIDGGINSVRLNHLPAGQFRFEVKAVNEDNIESRIAGVAFNVQPPFWQTPFFYVLLAVSTALLVAGGFIIRIRTIQRRASIREQVTSSQLTALKAQMNPHFMYNTLNSIQDLVLQKDIKSTNYYLSRYSNLMRKILDSSGSSEIDLAEETDMLQLYLELEQLRFGRDFSFTITCAPEIDRHSTTIPSMLIQPFVENALKHGLLHKKGEKRVDVSFERQAGGILCRVADNGVGRKKAGEIKARSATAHKSFATKATEKRLELINVGRAEKVRLEIIDLVSEGSPAGTVVLIHFPQGSAS